MDLAEFVLNKTETLDSSKQHYRLHDQLEAAVTSIPMNIAEGRGRQSKKEFIQFLHFSRGSINEVLTLVYLFHRKSWIDDTTKKAIEEKSFEVTKMLNSLISVIRKKL